MKTHFFTIPLATILSVNIALAFLLSTGCSNSKQSKDQQQSQNDLVIPVRLTDQGNGQAKIDLLTKLARPDLGIQDIAFVGDTLRFISTSFFFYYPFGKFNDIKPLLNKYPMLKIEVVRDTAAAVDLFKTTFNKSYIKFVVNDDTKRMEIVYGKILDKDIVFSNGIKVSLGRDEFFIKIFKSSVNLSGIKNVKIISALDGIFHNYHFESDRIASIEMDTDYQYYKF